MSEQVPAAIETAIKADLRPVAPLPSPARRTVRLAPLAALTLIAASAVFPFRDDGQRLGWVMTWGTSVAQAGFALALIALALREAVPGRTTGGSALLTAAISVLAFSVALTLRTFAISPTGILPEHVAWVGQVCLFGVVASALPLLGVSSLLAARAFMVRPWSSGALYGLGAGLAADAGWRLFCEFSEPAHVFPTHTGAVVIVTLLGAVIAAIVGKRLRR
jgi:hypothetical protein